MNPLVSPIVNEEAKRDGSSLRHSSTAPNLKIAFATPPPPPRRRGSVAELLIPKRKESISFFASPYRNRRNVSWRTTSTMPKLPLSGGKSFVSTAGGNKIPQLPRTMETPRTPQSSRSVTSSSSFASSIRSEIEFIPPETKVTPRQPRRQNGMVRLTPTPGKRKGAPVSVLPRLGMPLVS